MKKCIFVLATTLLALTSCDSEFIESPDTNVICENVISRAMQIDTLDSVEALEMTDELRELIELDKKLKNNRTQRIITTTKDPNYFSNKLALDGIPVTIKVRDGHNGGNNRYLSCSGAGKEIRLTATGTSLENQFYLVFLPAVSGCECVIYSKVSQTPLTVGYYTAAPSVKILVSQKNNDVENAFRGWNLIPSDRHAGYFTIENAIYMGNIPSSDPNGGYGITFNYVCNVADPTVVQFAQKNDGCAQQEFEIVPVGDFELYDIVYNYETAIVNNLKIDSLTQSKVNTKVLDQTFNFSFGPLIEQSRFTRDWSNFNINLIGNTKLVRPVLIYGGVYEPDEDAVQDADFLTTLIQEIPMPKYVFPVTIPKLQKASLKMYFERYDILIDYKARAVYHMESGEDRFFTYTGKWAGVRYENPQLITPRYNLSFSSISPGGGQIIIPTIDAGELDSLPLKIKP